jgi:hypothetical protein
VRALLFSALWANVPIQCVEFQEVVGVRDGRVEIPEVANKGSGHGILDTEAGDLNYKHGTKA